MLGKLPTAGLRPPRQFDDTYAVHNQVFSEGVFRDVLYILYLKFYDSSIKFRQITNYSFKKIIDLKYRRTGP